MLLAIPLAALVSLWVFSAGTTLSAALQRSEFTRMYKDVGLRPAPSSGRSSASAPPPWPS
ncbi:hypothetical protein ACFQY7_18955 [Actinomadura luteofluorescens]|uniref:hypothetical protein n=1 Tax=Actinomadura luteofluorescens TaxID=46163 RepID=UPI00362B397C